MNLRHFNNLAYEEIGEENSETILFLHTKLLDKWIWKRQKEDYDKHFKGFHCIFLDLPNHGESISEEEFSIEKSSIDRKDSILIFNIDTIRPNFVFPENLSNSDGYLECFEGNGANWSYAKTEDGLPMSKVVKTAEKEEISNYCSTGIYYFKTAQTFINAYNENEKHPLSGEIKELYVAPLYNYLINDKCDIRINVIKKDEVIFSGVPEEYDTLLRNSLKV